MENTSTISFNYIYSISLLFFATKSIAARLTAYFSSQCFPARPEVNRFLKILHKWLQGIVKDKDRPLRPSALRLFYNMHKVSWVGGQGANFKTEAIGVGSNFNCKEGCKFSMGWCAREPYCPLSSAVCNATIPTLPLFEMAESACSPFCYVLHDLLFISFFYHVCVTGQLLQHSTVQYSILYNNLDMFTYFTGMMFN